jgi:hypothetical protein
MPPRISNTLTDELQVALRLLWISWPTDLDTLTRAWRQKALATHPDRGGDHKAFVAVQDAREHIEAVMAGKLPAERADDDGEDDYGPTPNRHREYDYGRAAFTDLAYWHPSRNGSGNLTRTWDGVRCTLFHRHGRWKWCWAAADDDPHFSRGSWLTPEAAAEALYEEVGC